MRPTFSCDLRQSRNTLRSGTSPRITIATPLKKRLNSGRNRLDSLIEKNKRTNVQSRLNTYNFSPSGRGRAFDSSRLDNYNRFGSSVDKLRTSNLSVRKTLKNAGFGTPVGKAKSHHLSTMTTARSTNASECQPYPSVSRLFYYKPEKRDVVSFKPSCKKLFEAPLKPKFRSRYLIEQNLKEMCVLKEQKPDIFCMFDSRKVNRKNVFNCRNGLYGDILESTPSKYSQPSNRTTEKIRSYQKHINSIDFFQRR